MQFGHECRTVDAIHLLATDDQSKTACKVRLFYQAKSLGSIAHPLHVRVLALKDGFEEERV